MQLERNASAVWKGSGGEGSGTVNTTSGALANLPYSAKARFQNEDGRAGTNPEELIAAAHAGCFSMALSFALSRAGHPPEELRTSAKLTMIKADDKWTIDAIHLDVVGKVPGVDAAEFERVAQGAKAGCPVSRALNAKITLTARLG